MNIILLNLKLFPCLFYFDPQPAHWGTQLSLYAADTEVINGGEHMLHEMAY